MSENTPVFVLVTDFGLTDPYVGQLKAALFLRAPSVPILDLSHNVPPFAVNTGAFFLAASRQYYPPGAIFICIVDPGVGSNRDLLCIQNKAHSLLGPNNGLLYLAYRDMSDKGPVSVQTIPVGHLAANTFHGRDILVPAATALALAPDDVKFIDIPRTYPITAPDWAEATRGTDELFCTVLHVDRFGNCILNLRGTEGLLLYPRLSLQTLRTKRSIVLHQVDHYAEIAPNSLGILPGGQGFYELAMNGASAAAALSLGSGESCRILGNLWKEG